MTQDAPRSRVQSQIDENLKRVYEQALQQDVPDRFKVLLAQLRAKEQAAVLPGEKAQTK